MFVVKKKCVGTRLGSIRWQLVFLPLLSGLLMPLGFAPFHLPGLAILGLAGFFVMLQQENLDSSVITAAYSKKNQRAFRALSAESRDLAKCPDPAKRSRDGKPLEFRNRPNLYHSFIQGFWFGLGYFGLGVSWVYVSIHDYGHLNVFLSVIITLSFVIYLSCFPAFMGFCYRYLAPREPRLQSCLLFAALWCLSEWLRAILFGGFPWLMLGFGQIDTPLKHLLPIVGIYGVGFVCAITAACLAMSVIDIHKNRFKWIALFVTILIAPTALSYIHWARPVGTPVSVGVLQANLAMYDKWDDNKFTQLLDYYEYTAKQLLGKKHLVVLPESAIPAPTTFVQDFLQNINIYAKKSNSAILLGTIQPDSSDVYRYYNAMIGLGTAKGMYFKQHLVPFGEFVPEILTRITKWLHLPFESFKAGDKHQPLIHIQQYTIASLICYELAYPNLLRQQLPLAHWIVSISDDGWFGHSFAMYQQQQMAQALSKQTSREQIIANNDGLSSTINSEGEIVHSLPAFKTGILNSMIHPLQGESFWVYVGDAPWIAICLTAVIISICRRYRQKNC